jgi:hypothetical protein
MKIDLSWRFYGCFFISILSTSANAASCQDQSGDFVLSHREIQIRQNGCESLSRTELVDGVNQITENIILDGKYHQLPSMPNYVVAFTFDDKYRVGNAKVKRTNKLIAIFNSTISEQGDWVQQTIKFDANGNVVWTKTDTYKRKGGK